MLNIFGTVSNLGYGAHSLNILKALLDSNTEVNLTKIGQVQNDPYFEPYWQSADKAITKFDAKAPSLFIFHDEFSNQACGNPLAVFSIFEGTVLKPLSKHMLNNGPANMIFTTTEAHAKLLKDNGITKPIHVVYEGIDECIFNTIPATPHLDTKKFTFITVGKNEKRKCTNETVKAFIESTEGEEVALIAHTFNPFLNNQKDHPFKNLGCWVGFDPATYGFRYAGWTGKAHVFKKDKVDIYFTAPTLQIAEMPSLYHSANIGIQCSRAEGWGLPLSEMLACGLPTIATRCLGQEKVLRDLPDHQDLIIDSRGSEVANDGVWFKGDQGEWSTFDPNDLKTKIKHIISNKNNYTTKSEILSTHMSNNFTWSKTAETIKTILNLGA